MCALPTPQSGNPRPQRRTGWSPAGTLLAYKGLAAGPPTLRGRTATHLPASPGPGCGRPPPARLRVKPGAEAGPRLPRGGAARRTGHAQCAGPAPSAKRKRSRRSQRLRRGMRNGLAWLLHPSLPSTLRSILGARPPLAKRQCG